MPLDKLLAKGMITHLNGISRKKVKEEGEENAVQKLTESGENFSITVFVTSYSEVP